MNTLQLQFLMLIFAGWVNRGQQDVIAYLQDLEAAELPSNRVLRVFKVLQLQRLKARML